MNFKWEQVEGDIYRGAERQGFTISYIASIDSLFLFGGVSSPKDNDIYIYDLYNNRWRIQPTQGRKPSPRKYHASHYDQESNILIIHGGQVQKGRSSDQFYVLFIGTWKWKRIFLQSFPSGRQLHTLTAWKKDLIIFGGLSQPYQTLLNDTWMLKNLNTIKQTNSAEIYGPQCIQIQTKGDIPYPRFGHCCTIFKDILYLFGGDSQAEENYFTLHRLNLGRRNCTKQLSRFSIATKSQTQILIFGGYDIEDNQPNRLVNILTLQPTKIKKIKSNDPPLSSRIFSCFINNPTLRIYSLVFKSKPQLWSLSQTLPERQKSQQAQANLQDYLMSIKNQQILSQQLIKKNMYLEQLYLNMQNYISQLHADYIASDQYNEKVQTEKQKHIGHCLELKDNYGKIQQVYKDTIQKIKQSRMQLSALNQQFDKCMETEFDEDQDGPM